MPEVNLHLLIPMPNSLLPWWMKSSEGEITSP